MSKRIIDDEIGAQTPNGSKKLCVRRETDSSRALQKLIQLFPSERFSGRVPPVIMKHMVYSLVQDRTKVDREIVGAVQLRVFYLVSNGSSC